MSNCSGNTSSDMDIYRVGSCEKNATKYAMLENDTNLRNMTGRCGVVVKAPVEVGGGERWRVDGMNYNEVMERGFELTWRATDCGECAKSGGMCGYNATDERFVCFCTDRPHSKSCKPHPQSNIPPEQQLNDILISKVKNISDRSFMDLNTSFAENLTHQNCDVLNRSIPYNLICYQDQLNITLLKCKKLHYNVDVHNPCYKLGIKVHMASEFSSLSDSSSRKKFCERPPAKAKGKNTLTLIIIAVVVGTTLVIIVLAAAIFITRRVYKHRAFAYFSSKDKSRELEDASVYFGVSVFSYAELEDATNHFDSSKELGDGGFGTVYYGKLRDGREVAVKRLYEHNYKRVQQFMNEVEILTRLRHQNLVSLYGCTSRKSRELLLVYEYISNGTVADHLHGDRAKPSPLMWQTRMKIAIETASALVYLHASEIIHRDVKTNNILLDDNFCVKVADFGLSRLLPNDVTHVSTAPQGTPGYVDPEYHQCYQLTDKSDVYSFGVVLIELISSMPAIDISRSREEISLANMALNRIQKCALDDLIDPFLGSDPDTERMTTSVAELAFRCLQFDSETRPTMFEVLEVLKGIQVEESGDDVNTIKSELPPASPETEHSGLLKGRVAASPISVTAKWHSTSSELSTPSTSVLS
ncbi:leaf rust 10 disease-resistance locus receptor-like protein kinase-like 1.2 protein [Tanacetum coccineum]